LRDRTALSVRQTNNRAPRPSKNTPKEIGMCVSSNKRGGDGEGSCFARVGFWPEARGGSSNGERDRTLAMQDETVLFGNEQRYAPKHTAKGDVR
jgi:hypothetical protein